MNENSSNLASLGKRFVGALIDGVIVLAIIFPVMFATGVFQRGFQGQRTTATEHVVYSAAGIILFFILNGYLLIKRGQTIGKVVMKTKIVDLNGNIPNFGKIIILRYLLFKLLIVIPFIGRFVGLINILFILGKERRCLHDYAAGTIVINAQNIAKKFVSDINEKIKIIEVREQEMYKVISNDIIEFLKE